MLINHLRSKCQGHLPSWGRTGVLDATCIPWAAVGARRTQEMLGTDSLSDLHRRSGAEGTKQEEPSSPTPSCTRKLQTAHSIRYRSPPPYGGRAPPTPSPRRPGPNALPHEVSTFFAAGNQRVNSPRRDDLVRAGPISAPSSPGQTITYPSREGGRTS